MAMATQADRTPLLPLTPPSRTHQTSVILCDYGGATLTERTRRSGSGKTTVRMTLDIKATPILANLNGVEMGRGPSEAIRSLLVNQTLNITEVVKPSTQRFRDKAAAAYSRGAPWATRRWSGGRTGATPPSDGRSVRLGNHSGRLARGWFVTQNPKEGSWSVNAPANRFDRDTWTGTAGSLEAWIARFVSLVPALRDPRSILMDDGFRKAVASAPAVVAMTRTNMQAIKEWLRLINQSVTSTRGLVDRLGG